MIFINSTKEEAELINNYKKSKDDLMNYFSVKYYYDYFTKCLEDYEFLENCNYESSFNFKVENYAFSNITIITPKLHFLIKIEEALYDGLNKKRNCSVYIKHINSNKLEWASHSNVNLDDVFEVKKQLNLLLDRLENIYGCIKKKK